MNIKKVFWDYAVSVLNRMLGRIIAFFGIPVFGGLSIFVGAFFASKKYDIDVPPSVRLILVYCINRSSFMNDSM